MSKLDEALALLKKGHELIQEIEEVAPEVLPIVRQSARVFSGLKNALAMPPTAPVAAPPEAPAGPGPVSSPPAPVDTSVPAKTETAPPAEKTEATQ